MYTRAENISQNLLIAVLAVLGAGRKVIEDYDNFLRPKEASSASQSSSLFQKSPQQHVTKTDLAADEIIKQVLVRHLNEYTIVSEEGGQVYKKGESNFSWIVDPLDGTTNFATGFPFFVVSVALVNNETGQPQLAAVYNPLTTELFTAEYNKGFYCHIIKDILPGILLSKRYVYLNELSLLELSKLLASQVPQLFCKDKIPKIEDMIIDSGSSLPENDYLERLSGLMSKLNGVNFRDFSAAIYNGAKIAKEAAMAGMNATDLHLWDIAPIVLMVEEAGGAVSNIKGQDIGLRNYIKSTLNNYLQSYNPSNEEDSKANFKKAVNEDRGMIIAGANEEFLKNILIPALNKERALALRIS